jgi:ubiquinone biosynthesis protein COQ9
MRSPFADAERERVILAALPEVAFDGWTSRALRRAARRLDISADEAVALFPCGAPDMIAAFSHWADREMLARLSGSRLLSPPAEGGASAQPARPSLSLSRRVALALQMRFEALLPWREAVRRGLSILAMPHNLPLALRLLYGTVDAIWHGVGDRATDFSFYTKRVTLAGICAAATLYWLEDRSPEFVDTLAFIDRRLAGLHRLAGARQRITEAAERLPNPFRLLRPLR